MLLEMGCLTPEQLERAVEQQQHTGRVLGQVLLDLGYVTSKDLARVLGQQLNVPFLDLDDNFALEPEDVQLIPERIARKFCLIPVRQAGSPVLTVVMRDPLDIEALDTIRSLTNLEIQKAVASEDRIQAVIDKYYREDAYVERNIQDLIALEKDDAEPTFDAMFDADQLRHIANDAPVVRFVNLLLMQAVRDRASDIHFEPAEHDVAIRLRVDGRLRDVTPPPKRLYDAIVTRVKILSDMDIAERRLPRDGRFKFNMQGRTIDVRVSSLPVVHGEKIVLRILDRAALIVDLSDIGFSANAVGKFADVLRMPHGIVLLTGPTGSGKTTTLYSALNILKSRERNIQTVEDPVEYLIDGINQMQVKEAVGLDFASALRSILRQDPDVILIGEIRDLETARIAMRAAMTGHLVLSSLHTNDAASAFSRLRDIGVEPYLIAATVRAVISQRLVRKVCPDCKAVKTDGEDDVRVLMPYFSDAASWTLYHGKGCDKCGQGGYRGRTAIVEFLNVSEAIEDLVQRERGDREVRDRAIEEGMDTLLVSGFQRVKAGTTTVEEILSVCALTD